MLAWAKMIWNYRAMIDKPFFSVLEDFEAILAQNLTVG